MRVRKPLRSSQGKSRSVHPLEQPNEQVWVHGWKNSNHGGQAFSHGEHQQANARRHQISPIPSDAKAVAIIVGMLGMGWTQFEIHLRKFATNPQRRKVPPAFRISIILPMTSRQSKTLRTKARKKTANGTARTKPQSPAMTQRNPDAPEKTKSTILSVSSFFLLSPPPLRILLNPFPQRGELAGNGLFRGGEVSAGRGFPV